MGLVEYHKKRDFRRTPEPKGGQAAEDARSSFVVQKHAASHLHYDFRLELDGVLLSWAVPKGPSLDPADKRLAMRTEDHPIEYGTFEGVIPKGEYGGGTVMVWDRGRWEPEGDPREMLRKGRLRFRLHGQRLRGGFHLVRTRRTDGDKEQWLLMKGSDEEAAQGGEKAITATETTSAMTGRTMEEIESDPDRVWRSKEVAEARGLATSLPDPRSVGGAKKGALPARPAAQLATLVDAPPKGETWLHEIKLDGYRILARLERGEVRMLTRNGNDWTHRMPSVARAVAALPVDTALFDGEVVVLRNDGVTDFQELQNSLSEGRDQRCLYFLFDLLYLDGYDLRRAQLEERKQALRNLLASCGATEGRIRYSDHVVGSGDAMYRHACELGVEGIVSKRADRPYVTGRSKDWVKVKCVGRQELVIGGYSEPSGSRSHFGALLVGFNEGGELIYCGKVGTGFTEASLTEVYAKMKPLEVDAPPFANPPRGAEARGVHWLRPELVAEIEFTEMTRDGVLRHPSFRGLRQDKRASEIVRETPKTGPKGSRARSNGKTARSNGGAARSNGRSDGAAADLHITSPDKVLYPEQGLTKRELAEYYVRVAEHVLPHVADRPLTLVRCPEGHRKHCFFQKHAKETMPDTIRRIRIREKDGDATYVTIDDRDGLIALVQLGVLEIHTWGAHASKPERPDQLVMDLDPDDAVPWEDVASAALEVHERLESLGLESFLKTTGGKGLHVVVPIERRIDWDEAREFCRALAVDIAHRHPARYVTTMSKSRRKGRIFIDWLRNARGATAIAAFSTRARPHAPVSTPLAWDELGPEDLRQDRFDTKSVVERLDALGRKDPWKRFFGLKQAITKSMRRELATRAH